MSKIDKSHDKPAILIVDDQPDILQILKQLLQRDGYHALTAKSAEECYQLLDAHHVDAILLDIRMPKISGLTALAEIRKTRSATQLPIIMVTSLAEEEDIVEALENGANDYITKPLNFPVTIARLSTHLRLSELARIDASAREIEAVNAMIVTYNHEINNPLMVADLAIENLLKSELGVSDTQLLLQAAGAIDRINDIVKKIGSLAKQEVRKTSYLDTKMIKLD